MIIHVRVVTYSPDPSVHLFAISGARKGSYDIKQWSLSIGGNAVSKMTNSRYIRVFWALISWQV